MSDLISISEQMYKCIEELNEMRKHLKQRSIDKANAKAQYDKKLALTMINLKAGRVLEIDGEKVHYEATTGLEKIAKGICYQEFFKVEETEGFYKSLLTNIETQKAILNGLQSINKHLE